MDVTRTSLHKDGYRRLRLSTWLFSLCVAVALTTLFFTVWMCGVQIADQGMAPTINAGDVILFDRLAKFVKTPERGDVLAFFNEGRVCVGRVVGLPGETIEVDTGNVYINGAFLAENAYVQYSGADMPAITMYDGWFFIMPDDRTSMIADPVKMCVRVEDILGRAAIRVAPGTRMGFFA